MASIRANFLVFILPVIAISFIFLAAILTIESINRLETQSLDKINSENDYLQKNINNWLSFQISVISAIGDISVKSSQIGDAKKLDSSMLESIKNELGFRNVAIVDETGKAKISGNTNRIGADYSNLEYIKSARENKDNVIISNVRFSRVDDTPLISFAKTTLSGDTVFTSLPLKDLYKDYVKKNRIQKFNYSFILTANCKLLAHPLLGKGDSSSLNYKELCTSSKVNSFEENGENYIAYVSQNPLTKWFIVTAINKKAINEVIVSVIKKAITISMISLFIVVITIIILTGSMSRRMGGIVTMIDLASEGNIDELGKRKKQLILLASKRDEIGKIASATQLLVNSQEEKIVFAKAIANGDLNNELDVKNHDSLGEALRTMSIKLRQLIEQLITVVNEVNDTSKILADRSQDLQGGVIEQRSAVTDISDLISTLKEHINQQGKLVDDINKKADIASHEADNSKYQMQEMINSLEKINESGQNISGIMGDISDVADQTNLISLNAAIEASRAGEHGRGFAVVANEVRDLASRSSDAASQTSLLVDTSLQAIASGKSATTGTEKAFLSIISHVSELSDSLEIIKKFSLEQIATMLNLSTGLNTVEHITEINNALSEGLSIQCTSLESLTERLTNEIHKFKL